MAGGTFALAAIIGVAVNLRAAVTSVGALLAEVSAGVGLGPTLTGLMTALPVAAFAAFGALTPRLARRLGAPALLGLAMTLLAAGQVVRALASSPLVFLVTSAFALAGVAVANVLLPAIVRQYFAGTRISVGTATGAYTLALIIGSAVSAAAAVPIAQAAGSWRVGIGVWGLLAVVAIGPALALRRTPAAPQPVQATASLRPSRTRLGWGLAVFFGLQSFGAYAIMGWLPELFRDAGYSPRSAGLLLAGMTMLSVVMALVVPSLAARRPDQRWLVALLAASSIAGYAGLVVAPHAGALVWVTLLAVGQGAFPLALSLIATRASTQGATVALSAFAQSTGYLIAIAGPLAVGLLHDATGGWSASLGVLLVAAVIQAMAGWSVARPRTLVDE